MSSLSEYLLDSVVPGVSLDAVQDGEAKLSLGEVLSKTLVGGVVLQLQIGVVIPSEGLSLF